MNGSSGINISFDFIGIHVRSVLETLGKAMVFFNDGIKDLGEIFVRISITSVDTAMLIVEFHSTSNSLT